MVNCCVELLGVEMVRLFFGEIEIKGFSNNFNIYFSPMSILLPARKV